MAKKPKTYVALRPFMLAGKRVEAGEEIADSAIDESRVSTMLYHGQIAETKGGEKPAAKPVEIETREPEVTTRDPEPKRRGRPPKAKD